MPILDLMPDPPRSTADHSDASWLQLEEMIERLHDAARADLTPREFYRLVLVDACAATGATGGAAWRRSSRGQLEVIAELDVDDSTAVRALPQRREAVEQSLSVNRSLHAEGDAVVDGCELVVAPIADAVAGEQASRLAVGALELRFPVGGSQTLQQGRRELLAAVAAIAADYHALAELRDLRATAALQQQAVDLLRRIQQPHDLAGTAFAVANETRRLLACDRAAVLMKRGEQWRLLCVSGASRFDRKSEFARLSERLAENVANWGEPVVHEGAPSTIDDLPPRLATALAEHLDHSHARQLAAVPVVLGAQQSQDQPHDGARAAATRNQFDAVLIAEQFDGVAAEGWQRQLIEIAELAAPALSRAATLERFPVRTALRWAERWEALRQPLQRRRALWIAGGIVAAIAALVLIPAELTVEAPATLRAAVEREIFASATGSVAEVRVAHCDQVKQGDVLIVLSDPELSLKLQQVRGEIDATRERLAALAVTRTDRTLRERETEDRLPLSAEQRQLEERLATLEAQRKLLAERHEALTLRSPINGEVLTPDVQSLLTSRPVERGQALLTVADVASGWELVAETPQRDVGAIVEAQTAAAAADPPATVAASFRLSGDVAATYDAHVLNVSAAAPLEAEGLEDAAPPVKVRLAVDGEPPAAARPGMAASVRIDCGRRSLGYVWLHDAAATLYRWLTF
jgi:hypothetical protein